MSEDTTQVAPGGEGEVHECPEGEIWDEETQACVSMTEAEDKNVGATESVTEDLGLTQRFERTVKAYFDQMEDKFKSWMKTEFKRLQAESEKEAEEALRKSWGLEKDPVLRRSDLAKLARSMQLETAGHGKKSPASPRTATGPEGNVDTNKSTQSKAIEGLLKEYGVKK